MSAETRMGVFVNQLLGKGRISIILLLVLRPQLSSVI